ncbi:MAG: hypothetical protein M3336_14815 [Chloroflexota bacterium]|nr:hypothetical protein [Chloroflexota bacterium]
MLRLLACVLVGLLASIGFAGPAAAAQCQLCLDTVALQTRDGQPWTAGQPVTLVVRVSSQSGAALPQTGQAVVMQTDGDRTKCLGVPLKLVQADSSGGLYAGLFFPFRAARYDGKLAIGTDVEDITFDVHDMNGGAAPAGELPAAEPLDTSAPGPALPSVGELPLAAAAVLAALALVMVSVRGHQRRGTHTGAA